MKIEAEAENEIGNGAKIEEVKNAARDRVRGKEKRMKIQLL